MNTLNTQNTPRTSRRRGSTLIIVLALLGLLAFTGMLFYTFAAQERAAAEYFSEGAKSEVDEADDPFPWALEQMLVGASNEQKGSIFWSPTQRHSIIRNMIGRDVAPHTGTGMHVVYDSATGLPAIDNNFDGFQDPPALPTDPIAQRLNFVDAIAAWGGPWGGLYGNSTEGILGERRDYLGADAMPEPDVDYTYPDINHLFLGYKGWAIRDNGAGFLPAPRYERVRVIIPSFFRPQYMKSAANQGPSGVDVPTDPDWYDETAGPTHPQYSVRSFRPHALHIAGFDSAGTSVLRFLDATNPAHAVAIAALPGSSGPFPLRRGEGNTYHMNSPNFGRLGVWTGDGAATADTFELDSDNDGDGIREGIWLDTRYPLQETADGRKYAVLHSFTIHDLDGLIDLNSHGNLAGLPRSATVNGSLLGPLNLFGTTFLSQSNQGTGPHEINPLFALAPLTAVPDINLAFVDWYGANPTNRLEQANMELAWILTGRIDTLGASPQVFDGRWGDASALWYHRFTGGSRRVNSLPRPGRAGNLSATSSDNVNNFGGVQGFDDNQDALEGVASSFTGRSRGGIHPIDFSGRGQRTLAADPRSPNLSPQIGSLPERWPQYVDYPLVGNNAAVEDETIYIAGKDGNISTTGDNLLKFSDPSNPNFNANFEDPNETVNDQDRAIRPDDQLFGIQDLISAHLTKTDEDNAQGVSDRLENLAPVTFADNSERSELFTTLSNSFRHYAISHDMNLRPWEWSADSDGDGFAEFPPQFGAVAAFAAADPFRAQTRRLLFTEAFEGRGVQGQLPLSLNHILDVNRNAQTPTEGTPAFISYMRRTGLRFRPLIEHPLPSDSDGSGGTAMNTVTVIPTVTAGVPLPEFPPRTLEDREFWARRDRQQLARDIYVLLYTIGGAEWAPTALPAPRVLDYTGNNSDRVVYSEDRLRLMAQFAVNVVDAMDSDNVITKFEYDKNLGNGPDPVDGWNLDDDCYTFSATSDPASIASTTATNVTRDGMYPDDTGDRGVVYGVEAQQIAFSEVLGIRSRTTGDNAATPFDDSRAGLPGETDFLFVELQNILPSIVTLGSGLSSGETAAKTVWRLVRMDRTAATDPVQTVKEGAPVPPDHFVAFATDAAGRNVIDGGGRFTVSATTATGGNVNSSDFFVDVGTYDMPSMTYTGAFDGTYELIAPNSPNGTMPTTATPSTDPAWNPRCDLDLLVHTTSCFESTTPFLDTVIPYAGHTGLLNTSPPMPPPEMQLEGRFDAGGADGFDLVLQRRLNPDLPSISSEAQNPWVEVDRVRVEMTGFDIDAADTATEIRGEADPLSDHLQLVLSTERAEPLVDERTQHSLQTSNTTAFRSNSLKGDTNPLPDDTRGTNTQSLAIPNGGTFTIWQPHFNREFASAGELLSLPVYPPNLLTQKLRRARLAPRQQFGGSPGVVVDVAGASAMFLWPDLTPEPVTDAGQPEDNRWYRLFQFVEVPSRVNRMLGNYINLKRVPGKLNQNLIRHQEVYAGLLDDVSFMDSNPLGDFDGDGDKDGPFGSGSAVDGKDSLPNLGAARDRWMDFINERDGNVASALDLTPGAPDSGDELEKNFWIPGTPNSHPFRSYNSRQTGGTDDNGIESTLLRRFAFDKPFVAGNSRSNVAGEGDDPALPNYNYNSGVALENVETNRHWLEVGNRVYHKTNLDEAAVDTNATMVEHHQLLSKLMNNTTTVSNTFIIYGTAAYFEASEDPATGLIQIGGRMGLDLDGDSDPANDPGWEQRAVFIIDRTELFNAYDPGSGSVDWKRLVKHRSNLASDGK